MTRQSTLTERTINTVTIFSSDHFFHSSFIWSHQFEFGSITRKKKKRATDSTAFIVTRDLDGFFLHNCLLESFMVRLAQKEWKKYINKWRTIFRIRRLETCCVTNLNVVDSLTLMFDDIHSIQLMRKIREFIQFDLNSHRLILMRTSTYTLAIWPDTFLNDVS